MYWGIKNIKSYSEKTEIIIGLGSYIFKTIFAIRALFGYIYYSKKVLHHQNFTNIYKYHYFLSIPNLNFKFDTALEDSIQYLTNNKFVWKHNVEICKIAFFCEYQYLRFFKSQQIFSGALEFSFVFKSLL